MGGETKYCCCQMVLEIMSRNRDPGTVGCFPVGQMNLVCFGMVWGVEDTDILSSDESHSFRESSRLGRHGRFTLASAERALEHVGIETLQRLKCQITQTCSVDSLSIKASGDELICASPRSTAQVSGDSGLSTAQARAANTWAHCCWTGWFTALD